MPTPALPPIPCTSPIPYACRGERVRTVWRWALRMVVQVRVPAARVCVGVEVEGAAAPADEQPDREPDDHHADRRLRALLDAARAGTP